MCEVIVRPRILSQHLSPEVSLLRKDVVGFSFAPGRECYASSATHCTVTEISPILLLHAGKKPKVSAGTVHGGTDLCQRELSTKKPMKKNAVGDCLYPMTLHTKDTCPKRRGRKPAPVYIRSRSCAVRAAATFLVYALPRIYIGRSLFLTGQELRPTPAP